MLWKYLKRILRYLEGSIELKLVYKINYSFKDLLLIGYADADWGNDEKDRVSTSGYLFVLFEKCVICWNTRKQKCVADSTCYAEYIALYECTLEALFLKLLLKSINFDIKNPITIFENNNGCITVANIPTSHKRSKHFDIKYHLSREHIEKKIIKVEKISTNKQLADMFTKPLSPVKFIKFRNKMNPQ